MWRKICHVEKFQIFIHDRCGDIWNLSTSVMWRYFRFPHITNVKKSEMWRIQKLLHMWRNFKFLHNTDVICDLCYFVANLFCRNLRAFVWRKIYPKIVYVEKKWQISGMVRWGTCLYLLLPFLKFSSSHLSLPLLCSRLKSPPRSTPCTAACSSKRKR